MSIEDRSYNPNYRQISNYEFEKRIEDLKERYKKCDLCAYNCKTDRTKGEKGACRVDNTVYISSYFPHFGEEDCLKGWNGSGTIFLSYCNMSCVFCQNFETSQNAKGEKATPTEIAEMAIELQSKGCHNINFVSPTHHSPHLVESIKIAREKGLKVPVIWNCGGYERKEILEKLKGIVDIYMPDIKWSNDKAAAKYSKAPNYWSNIKESLVEMQDQVGELKLNDKGIATQGLLIRHLVMPNHVENAKDIFNFVAEKLSKNTYVNIMSQYRPHYKAKSNDRYEKISRKIKKEEYKKVVNYAKDVGLKRIKTNYP